ncbi:hypothetical protein ACSFA7_32430 [Variovorax sp. LT1R20]|uniref:hypothetical protein n=1 Tax=Variovorax sp. LT1R20 TaxID=3443729 RepID=UPI003F484FD0
MKLFDEPLYLPDPNEPIGVLPWGKSPELTDQDLAAFQARLGKHRTPNYGQSYLLAANTLLRTAIDARQLDQHALPIFFLQRHAAELIVKAPLQFGLEIQKYYEILGRPKPNYPADDDQRKRAEGSHDLKQLLSDLEAMTLVMPVGVIPGALRSAVAEIDSIEKQHT